MRSTPKLELNCHDQSDRMRSIMKSKQYNDVIDLTSLIYVENESKLSLSI